MNIPDNMFEGYLDAEEKFYDYRTSQVDGEHIFDEHRTGISFYDQFLNDKEAEYLRDDKNLVAKIVYMSPNEYYTECGKYAWKGRTISPESLKQQRSRDTYTLNHLKDVLSIYKRRFPMPFINYAEYGQEGLHRMYVAGELLGWDSPKHPVLAIHWADPERHEKEEREKLQREIEHAVEKSIHSALRYHYCDKDELESQLQSELDREFEFIHEVKKPVEFDLTETSNSFILTLSGTEYPIEKEEIHFVEKSDDDFDDFSEIDDADFDLDIDEFLRKYLK